MSRRPDIGAKSGGGLGVRKAGEGPGDSTNSASSNEYAEILITDGSTAMGSIDTSAKVVDGWANDGENGESSTHAPQFNNNRIQAGSTGLVQVLCALSFAGTASVTFEFEFAVNGVGSGRKLRRAIGTGGDVGSCAMAAILDVTSGDFITVTVRAISGTGRSITVEQGQLQVHSL